jgi:colicin import membrane protein
MSSATFGLFERPEHGMGRSFALSAIVHIALVAVLVLGVRWQVRAPDTVEVDLVEAPPPAPPAPVVEPPKPVPAPKVEPPPPQVKKPDIAIQEKPKPKPKPKPEPKPEPKPKADPNFEKRLREQMAQEQRMLDQQRAEHELRELLAKQQADAARQAAAAQAKALNAYIASIQRAVKSNWILPQNIQGNPEAVFLVVQIPSGDVISVKLVRSSGNRAYDEAVERAILKSSPLPKPPSPDLFSRELKLTFRPQDK